MQEFVLDQKSSGLLTFAQPCRRQPSDTLSLRCGNLVQDEGHQGVGGLRNDQIERIQQHAFEKAHEIDQQPFDIGTILMPSPRATEKQRSVYKGAFACDDRRPVG